MVLLTLPTLSPAVTAYAVTDTTFAAGVTNATVQFQPGTGLVSGPNFHLLTNATYLDASLDLEGVGMRANATATRSSSTDFNNGLERTHVSVFMGTLSMNSTALTTILLAANSFGSGVFNNTAVVNGNIVLNGSLAGTYTTPALISNGAPWGFLIIDGVVLAPSTATFNLLDPNDVVLATGLESGQRIPFNLDEIPSLKFQLVLTATATSTPPAIAAFGFGERAADYNVGNAVQHTAIGAAPVGDLIRTLPTPATLAKDAANPVVNTTAATYYSQYLSQPFVVDMGGTWWMYMGAGANVGHSGAGIARATSTNLLNWTIDAAPLLTPTAASYDQYALTHPYVFKDPEGSGYIMLYTAWSSSLNAQLARATSPDGVNWTKTGVVLGPGASAWENFAVGMPALVQYSAGTDTYTLYYSGSGTNTGGGYSMGRATSNDGVTWTRDAQVMARTGGGPDQDDAQGGKITGWANTLYYYYTCNNAGYRTCLAISANGTSWTKIGRVINTTASAFDSTYATDAHAVISANGTLYVFYAGFDGTQSRIGRTTASFQAAEYTGMFQVLAAPYPDWVTFSKSGSNPVIPVAASTYYSAYLSQPQVVEMGPSEWWMYMSANTVRSQNGAAITRAVSTDLLTWTMDPQPVLTPTPSSSDSGGMMHPYLVENPWAPGWFLYYTAISGTGFTTIAMARSDDAVNWTKVGTVFNGSGTGWDAAGVSATAYMKYNASADRLRMWYAGNDGTGVMQTGIASSPNGVNWTRITNNPVLPRGPVGSVDRNMAQGGKIIDMKGTLAFYYSCDAGLGKINTCMATSVDGGFSFSKLGLVLNASASGFDSAYAADAAPILGPNAFKLFYAGLDPSTSQIGVADGAFNPSTPGAWAGRPQELPRFISGFSANGSAGSGAALSYAVRSSNDGLSWSTYESVSASDTMVFTAPRRFIQYRVQISAGAGPSVFDSAMINFSTYHESGRWRSDHIMMSAPIDRFRINATFSGAGHIEWYAEIDDVGTVAAIPNKWAGSQGGGYGVILRADLFGSAGEAPQLYSVTIRVESDGLPADVAVRVGPTGTPRFAPVGNLSTRTRVSIPGSDFQAVVNSYLTQFPNGISTDVVLNLTSTHFGIVKITNLTLNYTLKNPIAATYVPAATAITLNETETGSFSVSASTCCGSVINYTWIVDGVQAADPPTPTAFTWTPSYNDQGTHTVTLQMFNGETTVLRVWTVTVRDVNRPPTILSVFPLVDPTISYKASQLFSVEASDPDGNSISFSWAVDGVAWDATSNETSIGGLTAGLHRVTVAVWDATKNTTKEWLLNLFDGAPFATFTPDSPVSMSHLGTLAFTATASDPDGDMVTFRWTVDGVARPETSNSINVVAPFTGTFTVSLTMRGGTASALHNWTVTSTDSPPEPVFGPSDTVSASHSATTVFHADATDPDGDEVSYQWLVDGVEITQALAASFAYQAGTDGVHNVTAFVVAGGLTVTHKFTVTATNAAPRIGTATPSGGVGQDIAAAQTFSVTATDPDGDPLTYAWTLNGNARSGASANMLIPAGLPSGQQTLTVKVSDGHGGTNETTWTFTVPSGSGSGGGFGGSTLFLLLGLVAAAAVVALVVMRKKKKGPSADAAPAAAAPAAPAAPAPPQRYQDETASLFAPSPAPSYDPNQTDYDPTPQPQTDYDPTPPGSR